MVGGRLHEPQRCRDGAFAEYLLACPQQQRVLPEPEPINEVQVQEAEAVDDVDLIVPLLERGDLGREVAPEQARALPTERLRQSPAGDILGHSVEQFNERRVLRTGGPVAGEDLIGATPEQQGLHAPGLLEDDGARVGVYDRWLPATVREAVVAVLIARARALSPPVEGSMTTHRGS